uniref:Uncharacterized protein n=1 Tax=Anguilla anguilla TaxID=7936 RepID=A0A0E9SNZ2_ANGAN
MFNLHDLCKRADGHKTFSEYSS